MTYPLHKLLTSCPGSLRLLLLSQWCLCPGPSLCLYLNKTYFHSHSKSLLKSLLRRLEVASHWKCPRPFWCRARPWHGTGLVTQGHTGPALSPQLRTAGATLSSELLAWLAVTSIEAASLSNLSPLINSASFSFSPLSLIPRALPAHKSSFQSQLPEHMVKTFHFLLS